MFLEISANSDKGGVRERNEDMILIGKKAIRDSSISKKININKTDRFIIAVADGIGGHKRGDIASEIVTKELSDFIYKLPSGLTVNELARKFDLWVQMTHRNVAQRGINNQDYIGMGTTLVALIIYEEIILWINCGDSRIYRLRNNILTQLSEDHTLAALTGNTSIPSNIITNSIGAGELAYLDMEDMSGLIFDQDAFLLCSDGLSDVLSDEVIEEMLLKSSLDQLVNYAIANGSVDNVSACLVKFQV